MRRTQTLDRLQSTGAIAWTMLVLGTLLFLPLSIILYYNYSMGPRVFGFHVIAVFYAVTTSIIICAAPLVDRDYIWAFISTIMRGGEFIEYLPVHKRRVISR